MEPHKKSTNAAIRNLEVQMVQLAKQIVERPTRTFGTNTEMNPKQECKVIFTTRESAEKEKRIEEDVHNEEEEKKKEKKIRVRRVVIRSQPLRLRPRANQLGRPEERYHQVHSKEAPYPLVPSKKDKECYFKQFLDIFQKLEINSTTIKHAFKEKREMHCTKISSNLRK